MLSDRRLSVLSICPVCLVCNVGVLWLNGWTDQDETWHAWYLLTFCSITKCNPKKFRKYVNSKSKSQTKIGDIKTTGAHKRVLIANDDEDKANILASPFFCFSFFIILFCSVPCCRLSWLIVSFWAHVNIVNRIVSYRIR